MSLRKLKSSSLRLLKKGGALERDTNSPSESTSSIQSKPKSKSNDKLPTVELTTELKRMYNSEQLINFRHIYRLLATKSTYTFTERDIAPPCVTQFANAIGQFAELAWGRISAPFVWGHLEELGREGFPLDRRIYDALPGSILVDSFYGTVAKVHSYLIYRQLKASYEKHDQLVICFSGTDGPHQALRDIKTNYHRYRHYREDGCLIKTDLIVHSGFWGMYKGVRARMQSALRTALEKYPEVKEIVVGGHSLGGAFAYLLCLDLLQQKELTKLTDGRRVILAAFGAPRVGNQALVNHWKKLVTEYRKERGPLSLQEISVRAYNDGVPTLPMSYLGFRHFSDKPYYLYRGNLFEIPTSEKEHTYFPVNLPNLPGSPSSTPSPAPGPSLTALTEDKPAEEPQTPSTLTPGGIPHYPRGGHNYYGRDFEKLGRSMEWIDAASKGEEGWEKRYVEKRDRWEKRWERKVKG